MSDRPHPSQPVTQLTQLECSECDCNRFSWVTSQVTFGDIQLSEDGQIHCVGLDHGDIVSSEGTVQCTDCQSRFRIHRNADDADTLDLIPTTDDRDEMELHNRAESAGTDND